MSGSIVAQPEIQIKRAVRYERATGDFGLWLESPTTGELELIGYARTSHEGHTTLNALVYDQIRADIWRHKAGAAATATPTDDPPCAECGAPITGDAESTYCGSMHRECLAAHAAHCGACGRDVGLLAA